MNKVNTSADHVALIIKKLLDWYMQVFHAYVKGNEVIKPPYILLDWLQNSSTSSSDQQNFYDDMIVQVEEVIKLANEFIDTPKINTEQSYAVLEKLNKAITSICDQMVQANLDNDGDQEDLIIRSGLNAQAQLIKDFEIEIERRARHGSSFVLGLVTLKATDDQDVKGRSTQDFFATAAGIKKCMRVFDDAYVLSDNEFAVMLKETDSDGGIRFYKRLDQILDNTTSKLLFCASEPVPGDKIDHLIKHMRLEVQRLQGDDPSSVIHKEVSALELFMQENKDA